MDKPYVIAAVLAAGIGSRMNSTDTKQKMNILGKSVVRRSVELFDMSGLVDEIVVVIRCEEEEFMKSELASINKPCKLVVGGKTRAKSAKNAFLATNNRADFVVIHDAARCITSIDDVENVIRDAFKFGAATASREVFDTVKEIDDNAFIKYTHKRSSMRFAETPQVFSRDLYKKALDSLDVLDSSITDDNMLLEKIGERVYCTKMQNPNPKITTKTDISYVEFLLKGMMCDE